ncbi:MAG: hypothetical protein ACPGJS_07120 [Flammeovirgaceae bacterium]
MKAYIPISCSIYDKLEHFATLGKTSEIVYVNALNNTETVFDKISNLITKDKVEYLITENGLTVRLDDLIRVNGEEVMNSACSL